MAKAFTDKASKQALKAFETISNYCRSNFGSCGNCGGCVFAADLDGVCLFQDSVWMSDNVMASITKEDILERATELME